MSENITNNPSVPTQIVSEVKFPRFINNLGIIPTSYKDSMSYYESLAWLCKYLEETVIPTVNQNGDAVQELQALYIQLNDYVTHYFDNLDVQTEINNKLDDMVEQGTLQQIIGDYFDYIVPEMFGAVGDGLTNDTQAWQDAIDYCIENEKILYGRTSKKYLVDKLTITSDLNIDGKECTLLSNGDDVIEINNTNLTSKYIKNIHIENVPANKVGIYCNPARRYNIHHVTMKNIAGTGIKVRTYGGGILVTDTKIDGNPETNTSIGIDVKNTSDGVYKDIIMTDICQAVITNKSNIFVNVHPWIATRSLFANSKAFIVEGGDSLFLHCYPDTYHYNFYISNNAFVNIDQCKQYHNVYVANQTIIENAGGNIYAFYYDTQATSKNTFIHNSTFSCQLNGDFRYGNQSNLEKPLYNIDRTTQWKGYKEGQGLKYINLTFTPNDGFNVLKSECKFNNNICWYNIRAVIGAKSADTDINIGTIDTNFLPANEILAPAYYGFGAFVIDGIALVRINTQGVVTIRLPEDTTNNGTQVVFNVNFFSTQQS